MQPYYINCLTVVILALTGVMDKGLSVLGLSRKQPAFLAAALVALGCFELFPYSSVRFNAGALLLPVIAALNVKKEDGGLSAADVIVCFVMCGAMSAFYELDFELSYLAVGAAAGLSVLLISAGGGTALFFALALPVFSKVLLSAYDYARYGFAALELSDPLILDAEAAALFFLLLFHEIKARLRSPWSACERHVLIRLFHTYNKTE